MNRKENRFKFIIYIHNIPLMLKKYFGQTESQPENTWNRMMSNERETLFVNVNSEIYIVMKYIWLTKKLSITKEL